MPNRVEELEMRVAELESTVEGLTAELVSAKERIRLLEDHVEGDVQEFDDVDVPETAAEDGASQADQQAVEATVEAANDVAGDGAPATDEGDDAPDEDGRDEIIVA